MGIANLIVVILPLGLLAGAVAFQHVGGLVPCEMCMMQRWPHVAASAIGMIALCMRDGAARRIAVMSAAFAILASAGIAIDHLGVERHWWEGHTACTAALPKGLSPEDLLERMVRMPVVRCDVAQWRIMGLSLADLNALASGIGGVVSAALVTRARGRIA